MLIYILVLDGVFDIGLASLMDVISMAKELASLNETPSSLEVRLVSVRRKVRTAQGLVVPTQLATDLPTPDFVMMPALGAKMPASLEQALARRDVVEAGLLLKQWVNLGASVGAACTGTFILAENGLLDGQRATTSWWLSSFFRRRYPRVTLDESRMLVNSSCFITAGAALAHLDLGLSMVRRQSPALARICARYLLVESRASQAAFIIPDHVAHADPIVERFERWARTRLAKGFSMSDAAYVVGASQRTLVRRMQATLGKSPLEYFQDIRVEHAVHMLQTGHQSVEHIAGLVGYANGATLRALLRRKLGKGVRELRVRDA